MTYNLFESQYMKIAFLFILPALLIGGCKKVVDMNLESNPPKISLVYPYNHQEYSVGDTMKFKFRIQDENQIDEIKITAFDGSLIDTNLQLEKNIYNYNKPVFEFDTAMIVTSTTPKYFRFFVYSKDILKNSISTKSFHFHIEN